MQPQTGEHEAAIVSIVELKDIARSLLPPSSGLRHLILSEPDLLPRGEAILKAKTYARLLYHEVGRA
ncbi:MAG TPA: hypothetical protein VED22_00665 [Nitrososphaerales archaeon]|nr:hypothetical protein [Nitrososphaerales archaeon]